ncbi:MAG: hydrogenase maturation protease, partial [Trichodesmium sp. St19_bin2]|nr:hydrogenase maturation protease [Trichodesmium sp. St19_bin2]
MLTIIGCGNFNRSDDGVGVIIAQRLQQYLSTHPLPNVQVYDCGTAGMEVMFQARGTQGLIIVDASATGSEPGAVFKVPSSELEALPEPSYSLHDFRWDNALAVGRKIFREDFPED